MPLKLYNISESLIREQELGNQSQFCVKKFGRELFGDQLGGEEKNTDIEKFYAKLIEKFTLVNYGKNISGDFIHAVEDLKNCMSTYPEILYPEGTAYRGTIIKLGDLIRLSKSQDISDTFKLDYNGKSPIQSWSSRYDVAEDFSTSGVMSKYTVEILPYISKGNEDNIRSLLNNEADRLSNEFTVPIVVSHDATPDQYLFKGEYFQGLSYSADEDEILRIDNRTLRVNAVIASEFKDVVIKLIDLINGKTI